MASCPPSFRFSLLAAICLVQASLNARLAAGCYTSIISFGDALTDTGNLLLTGELPRIGRLPYGETFFHHSTGRFSDGRLIIDFIAKAIGLPFVRPFLRGVEGGEDFRYGVNFAVGEATALDDGYFRSKGMEIPGTKYSLSTQLKWFKQLLPSLCSCASQCDALMRKALFLVGEIGGNDYNHPIFYFGIEDLDEMKAFVPDVVSAIGSAVEELMELGARTMVVPGNFSIGCLAIYLTLFRNNSRAEDYDPKTGCINWLNDFAMYHNRLLLKELSRQRRRHPNVTIIYGDYYEAAMTLFRYPRNYGFGESALAACCGSGGPYNTNLSAKCGDEGAAFTVCSHPYKHISWDGIHLTEAAYNLIASGLLGSYTTSLSQLCPQINWNVLGIPNKINMHFPNINHSMLE